MYLRSAKESAHCAWAIGQRRRGGFLVLGFGTKRYKGGEAISRKRVSLRQQAVLGHIDL